MTHATISLIKSNGIIKGIRVTSGGMIEEAGQVLLDHYTTEAAVEDLINHGNAICIRDTISTCEFYYDYTAPAEEHTRHKRTNSDARVRLFIGLPEYDGAYERKVNAPIKDVLNSSSNDPVGDFREKWDFTEGYDYVFRNGKWYISGWFYEKDAPDGEDEKEYYFSDCDCVEFNQAFIDKYC